MENPFRMYWATHIHLGGGGTEIKKERYHFWGQTDRKTDELTNKASLLGGAPSKKFIT